MERIYRFTPLKKTLIWGTETWLISGVAGNETPVSGDSVATTINDLVREQKDRLVGKANYERFGDEFPLLVKFIDAKKDLSIQVHPTNEIARRHGKGMGKTEMWYVMESAPEAKLYSGLKMHITPEQYKQMVEEGSICDALAQYSVKEGDCFFIPAGRIHSICSGTFLAEIQQTSDITYRIYDYKRKDKDGKERQLHTQEASESIDYTVLDDYRTHYTPRQDESQLLVQCPYFNTAVYDLTEPMTIDYSDLDSFVILIAIKGEGTLIVDGEDLLFRAGDTLLLPATTKEVRVEGTLKFLETYVI